MNGEADFHVRAPVPPDFLKNCMAPERALRSG
jgi:hypothetical protein